jgi:hypothetical protein
MYRRRTLAYQMTHDLSATGALFGIMRPHAKDVTYSGQPMSRNTLNATQIGLKRAAPAVLRRSQGTGGIRQQRGGELAAFAATKFWRHA